MLLKTNPPSVKAGYGPVNDTLLYFIMQWYAMWGVEYSTDSIVTTKPFTTKSILVQSALVIKIIVVTLNRL